MSREKALPLLVGVRQRRGRALDDAVQAAVGTLEGAEAELRAARQTLVDAVAAEAGARAKLLALTDAGQMIDVTMMAVREHLADEMKARVAQRQQQVEHSTGERERRAQELRARRADVARNRQKIEALQADIAALRAERQRADDDQQDEESEETAVARLLHARRPPAEVEP